MSLKQLATTATSRGTGLALVLLLSLASRPSGGEERVVCNPSDHDALHRQAVKQGERFWKQIATAEPYPNMGSRQIFGHIVALCQARMNPERLLRLVELAERMQDRKPTSPGFGNFRWYWRNPEVTDQNAVEFCMQDAALAWVHHAQWIPEPARGRLRSLLEYGADGCLRHRVSASYTNIALFNAANLIVLGERLDRPATAADGYRRLDALHDLIAAQGVHEFCSPTYYGTDLSGLLFIEANARHDRQREQARALLKLFWTDIALNWYPPALRLAGSHSRSYDYLHGLGALDWHLWVRGWLPTEGPGKAERFEPFCDGWSPPASLRHLSEQRFPRLVRQSWGSRAAESRTHMLYRDVTLSSSGATYCAQDMPLTVDLPGERTSPRCYFLPDGREDPYGKKAYPTGSAGHKKALHLAPFWAGAQRSCDALGLVLYRPGDLSAPEVIDLQSHFVLPRNLDGIWLSGKRLTVAATADGKSNAVPVEPGQAIVLRRGTAAIGLRWVWTRARDGRPASVSLVDDGNSYGCLRLTVGHRSDSPLSKGDATARPAGAALWIRVGTGLKSDGAFEAWRNQFQASAPTALEVTESRLRVAVPGLEGPVEIAVEPPFGKGSVALVPEPCRGVLELDGIEIGRPLLTGSSHFLEDLR